MKLFDAKKGTKIRCKVSDGSKYIIFDHIDGLYSYCTSEKGAIVHLNACTPLRKIYNKDEYRIAG